MKIANGRIIGSCECSSFKRSSTCVFFSLPVVKFETFILCNFFPWHWQWRVHTLKAPLTSMLMEISIYRYFHTLVLSGLLIILELCVCNRDWVEVVGARGQWLLSEFNYLRTFGWKGIANSTLIGSVVTRIFLLFVMFSHICGCTHQCLGTFHDM